MATHSIFVLPNGDTKTVYSDDIIGIFKDEDYDINRATDVVFNKKKRLWEAIDSKGNIIASDKKRVNAVKKEVIALNEKLREASC